MRKVDTKLIEKAVYDLAIKNCVEISSDCVKALKNAEKKEDNKLSDFALKLMIENSSIAKRECMPACQDTGLACVFVEIGQEVFLEGIPLKTAINEGIKKAYKVGAFRKSVVDPLTGVNTKDNTPAVIHTDIVKGDKIKISFMPKGFGSENMSKIYMLSPADGKEGIINAIVDTVKTAGAKPCPPVIVGVCIGGTFDTAAVGAKKALLRKIGSFNKRKDVRELEEESLKRINLLGIGAQGFGGKTTALAVLIDVLPTHIAGLPVAVNIQCHAKRCGSVTL